MQRHFRHVPLNHGLDERFTSVRHEFTSLLARFVEVDYGETMMGIQTQTIFVLVTWLIASSLFSDEFSGNLSDDRTHLVKRINALIIDLDADSFQVRDRAQRELREIGPVCVPALHKATIGSSAELAKRIHVIQEGFWQRLIVDFSKRNDRDLNVEEGMWLISCIETPQADRAEMSKQLDGIAEEVRQRLGGVDPATADPKLVVNSIVEVLFRGDNRFYGNVADYENPANSSLHHVLRKRTGLPILLSHLIVSVSERLGVPIIGVGVPYRYMACYPGAQAPPGAAHEDIIIDAFGGQVLSSAEVRKLIPSFDPGKHLKPVSNRYVLVRMLSNLSAHLYRANDVRNGQRALKFQSLLVRYAQQPADFVD